MDRHATLDETRDRVLATEVVARWRYGRLDADWAAAFAMARSALIEAFASKPSLTLQQTLYARGSAWLESQPAITEDRLPLQSNQPCDLDLPPLERENDNEA